MTRSGHFGRRGDGARLGPALRAAGAVLLVAGLVAAARWAPAAPPGWRMAERFAFYDALCDERLGERETAPFTVPASRPIPLGAAELAAWFRLDAGAVCAANGIAAEACAAHAFGPGQEVTLPLGRGVGEADSAEAEATEASAEESARGRAAAR